ncbi:hypothetical protein [Aphanothece sacrum]|uniref:Uncharacterized protein n=1 Tax=Aphanothece sacrum FPU1 TaxID=1920663 RepID=A0A401ILX9_APHSA|nr:hypothetical protein [Aphanothece sacrum]GBF82262.1 hypothetical protein AsFPU1_3690 [Aphanothece sacrum FPU1]GBF87200.1 hypothetical protein AsFPU3_4282 [Aphanothece sacrum FPU3]
MAILKFIGSVPMSEEHQPSTSESFISSETLENGLSQGELVALLENTRQQLEAIVTKLNQESLESLPNRATVDNLIKSTEAIATFLTPTMVSEVPQPSPEVAKAQEWVEEPQKQPSLELEGLDRALPSFNRLESWWDGILGRIRGILPTRISERLSDWGITGILTGLLVTVLLTSVLFLSGPLGEGVNLLSERTKPDVSVTPPQLEAPESPQPVDILPPPKPQLTPEQSLIAAIQQEVTNLTSQYPQGLIGSIEANFSASRLIVTMGDQWYKLSPNRQTSLGNTILKRSKRLDFRKLELLDNQGNLIARNPVVGNDIIILVSLSNNI